MKRFLALAPIALAMLSLAVCPGALAQNAKTGVDHPSSATEDECIAVLQSDAAWQPKYEACTRLRQIGTVKSIPALAKLLTDEKLSHMARYALEPMPFPEATTALREALGSTKGPQEVGVITSLGVTRDEKSIKPIAKALKDKDPDVARAAAGALGRIGTVESCAILREYAQSAPEAIRNAVAEGELAGAGALVADNKGNLAIPIYQALADDPRQNIRLGALRGLVYADPGGSVALLSKLLVSDDPVTSGFAAELVAEVPGGDMTKPLANALAALPPHAQVLMLRGLGDRKDPAAREAAVAALASNDKNVKIAAAKALGAIGSAADVPALAGMLGSGDADLAAAARIALGNETNKDFDEAMATAVASANTAARASLVELLSDRMAPKAAQIAVSSLKDGDAAVRLAALHALAKMGGAAEAPAVIETLKSTQDDSERSEAGNALNAIAGVQGEAILPAVLGAMKDANPPARTALLRSLGIIGSPKALEPVVAALHDKNADISGAAVRVLADWKTADAAPHLLTLAQSGSVAQKDTALRGYVRLAQAEASSDAKAQMLAKAMDIAKTPEEKWLVLPAYGTLATKQSLDTLRAMLADPQVKNEAGSAIVTAATAFAKADAANKPAASEAIHDVIAKCDNTTLIERAKKALDEVK